MSSSEWEYKYPQHSSNIMCPPLFEQILSFEALDEIYNSALPSPGSGSRDHKAGGRISATLAPPIGDCEDEGIARSCRRIKRNPGEITTQYYRTSVLESPA